jgi:hypothetical protein
VRSANFIEYWCVKSLTAWLLTNIIVHILTTAFFYVEVIKIRVCNYLADRLHGEFSMIVSQLIELAINRAEGSCKPLRACLKKAWDVRGYLTT